MDSPNYSQDEFDLNLPLHHQKLKEKFHFLLEKSIASTKGSPILTPEPSLFDFQSKFCKNFRRSNKKTHKIDVFDQNITLFDMVDKKTTVPIKKVIKFVFYTFFLCIFFIYDF